MKQQKQKKQTWHRAPLRLWCIFELAGFLHCQGFNAGRSRYPTELLLEIRPTSAACCTLAISVSLFGGMLALLTVPFTNPILGTSLFAILGAVAFYVATDSFRCYQRCIDKLQLQLKSFDMQAAQCYCCSVNHVDPSGSDDMVCDREIISQCISNWFGSVESFHQCVHSTVFTNLSEQLQNRPYPASQLIFFSFFSVLFGSVIGAVRGDILKISAFLGVFGHMKQNSGLMVDWSLCPHPLGSTGRCGIAISWG